MICRPPLLNECQSLGFDRFLLGGTGKVLNALESMFELEIEKSESALEVAPATRCEVLRQIGDESLCIVSSDLHGQLQGSVRLLIRSTDLDHLANLLRPLLSLLFLSCPGTDLKTLDSSKPRWMDDQETAPMSDAGFLVQMQDLLTEMGNVVIGLYSKSILELSALSTYHSQPQVIWDTAPGTLRGMLSPAGSDDDPQVVVDNQFQIGGRSIRMWCVISLMSEAFSELLCGIDSRAELEVALRAPPRFAQVATA